MAGEYLTANMRNTTNKNQSQATDEQDPPIHSTGEQNLAIGLPQATELATAGDEAVVAPGRSRQTGDRVFSGLVHAAVWIFLLVLVGIAIVLVSQSIPSIQLSGLSFFTSATWDPVNNVYGIAPMIMDTLLVAGVAIVVSTIIGVSAAIFLVDFAPRWLREPTGFLIELLAFIPSVVYGLWALLVMSPFLQSTIQPWIQQNLGFIPFFNGPPYGVGVMAATTILSVMLLPLLVSLSREALLLVPTRSARLCWRWALLAGKCYGRLSFPMPGVHLRCDHPVAGPRSR